MSFLDMSPEISFETGGEAALVTVEFEVLVSGLDMFLQLVWLSGSVGTVRTGISLAVLGHHVPLEDLRGGAGVAALATLLLDAEVLVVDVVLEHLISGKGPVTVVAVFLLKNLFGLQHQVHPLLMVSDTARIRRVKFTLITIKSLDDNANVVLSCQVGL